MKTLITIGLIAGGIYLYSKRQKTLSDVGEESPQTQPEPEAEPPPPVWDPQTIEGLEDERIEGIYATAKLYKQDNGLYRLTVLYQPPPANQGSWAGTLGVTKTDLTLEKAKELADVYLQWYGYPSGPYGTVNDLLVLLYGPGDTRYSVWKHATKGTFWAIARSPGRGSSYAEFNDPQAALQHAIANH